MCGQQEAQCVLQDQVSGDLSFKSVITERQKGHVCVHLKMTDRELSVRQEGHADLWWTLTIPSPEEETLRLI